MMYRIAINYFNCIIWGTTTAATERKAIANGCYRAAFLLGVPVTYVARHIREKPTRVSVKKVDLWDKEAWQLQTDEREGDK